jgi:hypothetical protein
MEQLRFEVLEVLVRAGQLTALHTVGPGYPLYLWAFNKATEDFLIFILEEDGAMDLSLRQWDDLIQRLRAKGWSRALAVAERRRGMGLNINLAQNAAAVTGEMALWSSFWD